MSIPKVMIVGAIRTPIEGALQGIRRDKLVNRTEEAEVRL